MELLGVIRRWRHRDRFSIREIARRTGLSRNTVRKYLRADGVEPRFNAADRLSKLDPYADKLSHMLRQEVGRSRKQKRTIKQLHADLRALGYDGSYNRVAAFARDWKNARHVEQQTTGRGAFVPLTFLPGEAFQFDWSEDWAVIAGEHGGRVISTEGIRLIVRSSTRPWRASRRTPTTRPSPRRGPTQSKHAK